MRDLHEMARRFEQPAALTAPRLRDALLRLGQADKANVREIRLRTGGALAVTTGEGVRFVGSDGRCGSLPSDSTLRCTAEEVEQTFRALCGYSVHSHQNELQSGFVSLKGGHRAGICGTAVWEKGELISIREISSINIRVAHEILGAADGVMPLFEGGLCSLLLIGPPSSGKTTLLRDMIRRLSGGETGRIYTVSVVDERGELAAMWQAQAQNDLGPCCDVLTGFSKAQGILTAIRCLSPDVVVCDEVGSAGEMEAVSGCLNAGVAVIASAHASSLREVYERRSLRALLETGAFSHLVLLEGGAHPCRVRDTMKVGDWYGQMAGSAFADRNHSAGGSVFFAKRDPAPTAARSPCAHGETHGG